MARNRKNYNKNRNKNKNRNNNINKNRNRNKGGNVFIPKFFWNTNQGVAGRYAGVLEINERDGASSESWIMSLLIIPKILS